MEYDALKQPDRITHEYNMLMSSMHVSVGKHLLDPYFTVIWANDFFYEKTGYGREEYEATFHNHVSEYYSAFPDVYETMGKFIKTALKHGEPSYEFVCPMPVAAAVYGSKSSGLLRKRRWTVSLLSTACSPISRISYRHRRKKASPMTICPVL